MARETAPPRGDAITVRQAGGGDLARIQELLTAASLPTAGLQDAMAHAFVAVDGTRTVGVAALERHGAYAMLRSVAIEESHRGHGLGRQLVEAALGEAERLGLSAVYLLTTTAERYFPSFGFVPIDRSAVPEIVQRSIEFRSACPATATAMYRPLTPAALT